MEDQFPGAAAEGSVPIGAYSLEVGRLGSFARFSPDEERKNARELTSALEQEPDDRPAVVAAVEDFQESADAVTGRIEQADKLLRDAASGKLLDIRSIGGEVDALLDLCARLDSEGRFEEELRLMRSLNGLLALSLRWIDLIRSLWSLLRSAEAAGHAPAQAFAHHELGSLNLCAGRAGQAVDHLEHASRLEREIGDIAGSCATRHNLDSARRDFALRSGRWFRRPRGAQRIVVLAGALAIAGGSGAGIALAIHGKGHKSTPTTTAATHVVTVHVAGNGQVRGTGIACPGDCTATVAEGTRLRLHAVALGGARFIRWKGANCADATCPLVVGRDRAPTAVFGPPAGDTTPPSTPTGLSAKTVSASEIDLAWSPSTDNVGVTGYVIYRGGSKLTTVADTSFRDTSVAASTAYAYRVQAIDRTGNRSGLSSEARAKTPAAADQQPPSVPTGLKAAAVSTSEIDISWVASTDNVAVTGYVVYRDGIEVKRVPGDTTTYQDTGLKESTTYTYTVKALDGAGNFSGTSASATATTESSIQ